MVLKTVQFKGEVIHLSNLFLQKLVQKLVPFHHLFSCRLSGFRSSLQPEPIYLRPDAAVRAAEAAASGGARKETTSVWVISSQGRC